MESLSTSQTPKDGNTGSTTSKETPKAAYNRGKELAKLCKHKEAIESYSKAISLKPKFPQAYHRKGTSLAALGSHQEAIENFDMAILLQQDFELAYKNRGCSYAGLGNYEEAIKDFQTAQSLQKKIEPEERKEASNEVQINAQERNIVEKTKKHEGPTPHGTSLIERDFELAIQVDKVEGPEYALLHLDPELIGYYNQGLELTKRGLHEEAIKIYDKAIALKPDFAEVYTLKGVSLAALRRDEEAIRNYDKTISLKPGDATAYNNKGSSLEHLGRFAEALESHNQAIQLEPEKSAAHNNKALVLLKLGRYKEALESVDKALELNSKDVPAYINKGDCLYELKKYQEAIQCFDKAIELQPNFSTGHAGKANCFASLGRYQEAIELYTTTIQLDPGQLNCYIAKSMLLMYQGKKEEAAETVESLLALRPNSKLYQLTTSFNTRRKFELNLEGTGNPVALLLKEWPEFDPHTGQFILNVISTIYKEPPPEETVPVENKNLLISEEPEESSTSFLASDELQAQRKNENQPAQENYPSGGLNSAMHSEDFHYNPEQSLFMGGKHVVMEEDSYQVRVAEENSLVQSSHGDNKTQTETI